MAFDWDLTVVSAPAGYVEPQLHLVTASGHVAAGKMFLDDFSAEQAFLWTKDGGVEVIPGLIGSTVNLANGARISPDGDTVFCTVDGRLTRWSRASGITDFGNPTGANAGLVLVSPDFSTAVVQVGAGNTTARAYRWTESGGYVSIGLLAGKTAVIAWDASDDCNIIYGYAFSSGTTKEGFRWTQATGVTSLGLLGGAQSFGGKCLADGFACIGNAVSIPGGTVSTATVWTQASGMQVLPRPNVAISSFDYSVARFSEKFIAYQASGSANTYYVTDGSSVTDTLTNATRWLAPAALTPFGDYIAGTANDLTTAFGNRKAAVYSSEDGIVELESTGISTGVQVTKISNDGRVVVGYGQIDGIYSAFVWGDPAPPPPPPPPPIPPDRKVTLSVSKDFGHNFLHQREAELPAIGEYARVPVEFRRFGHARDFRAKIRVTSPIVADFMGGEVEYEVGDA